MSQEQETITAVKPIDSVVILHGFAESPQWIWYPWLKKNFLDFGIAVDAPQMPHPLRPHYEDWVGSMRERASHWGEGTMVIGHNLGGVLALRLLEQAVTKKIHTVALVSTPFAAGVHVDAYLHFFSHPIDWAKVRGMAANRILIQSKNDHIIPYDHALRYKEYLDAALLLSDSDGHFMKKDFPELIESVKAWLPQ